MLRKNVVYVLRNAPEWDSGAGQAWSVRAWRVGVLGNRRDGNPEL